MNCDKWLVSLVVIGMSVASPVAAQTELQPQAHQQSSPFTFPANITVEPQLRPFVAQLLARSATFRAQTDRIASSRHVRVVIRMTARNESFGPWAARTVIQKFEGGMLKATVELPAPLYAAESWELIAHEFEHITEQIDGVDLQTLAEERDGRAWRFKDGSFETDRARDAGMRAAREAIEEHDGRDVMLQVLRRVGRTLRRAVR